MAILPEAGRSHRERDDLPSPMGRRERCRALRCTRRGQVASLGPGGPPYFPISRGLQRRFREEFPDVMWEKMPRRGTFCGKAGK